MVVCCGGVNSLLRQVWLKGIIIMFKLIVSLTVMFSAMIAVDAFKHGNAMLALSALVTLSVSTIALLALVIFK
ncbi:TMhelix containing protein [Vibrio phage 1.083.O._10N.286.52.B9]|nr:TMhelix containing protein [Vibrio phage 1.083.O._10N.286.52.B9]